MFKNPEESQEEQIKVNSHLKTLKLMNMEQNKAHQLTNQIK